MDNFFDEVINLPGKEKLNVYALLIAKLSKYDPESVQDKRFIKPVIVELKNLFLNHETSFNVAAFFLKHHLKQHPDISIALNTFIRHVIKTLQDTRFQDYFNKTEIKEEALDCRISRYFESSIAIHLLQNPSQVTWDCVNQISKNIIQFIRAHPDERYYQFFLEDLGPDYNHRDLPNIPLAFGRFAKRPNIEDVLETLTKQNDFAKIMLIHFMFMRDVYFNFEPDMESQNTIRHFGYGGSLEQAIVNEELTDVGPFFYRYVNFALYKDRGRGEFKFNASNSLGICINPEDREKLPVYETTWFPDCICQEADFSSEYTTSLINKGIPYVAGPSGMTSLLSASMLFMGQYKSIEEHNHYILAIMSFITAGGLHSIHEVLQVPHERLGLLKFYKPSGPHAGNYGDFFNLFRDDKTIKKNIKETWEDTVNWISTNYPNVIPITTYPEPNKIQTLFENLFSKMKF